METQEELRKKYNPEGSDLRRMQMRMLDMLKEVDKICKKYDIPYWLSDGTLLGCVRHGGFIPWDDDLDIQMLKKDYIRFCSVAHKELPDNLVLQNSETDEGFFLTFAKIRDLDSEICELSFFDNYYKYRGIFIDIFPLEKNSAFFIKVSSWLQWRFLFTPLKKSGKKMKRSRMRYLILHSIYKCFHVLDIIFCVKKIGCPYGSTFNPRYLKEKIFPLSSGTFEGKQFPIPSDVDNCLKCVFGDGYMNLPLEKDREWHLENVKFK